MGYFSEATVLVFFFKNDLCGTIFEASAGRGTNVLLFYT
jgi:hypothetical protein